MKNIFYRLTILLVTFSISWIFIYSLIEFHQHYVFHKNVDLWQIQFLKSNDNDSKKAILLFDKKDNHLHGFDATECRINILSEVFTFNLSEKSIFSRYIFDLRTPEYELGRILRAPPIA